MKIPRAIKKNGVFLLLLVFASGIWVYNCGGMIGAWSPIGDEGDVFLLSNDIIKNFKVDTFDGQGVTAGGSSMDGKMQFETQATWRINKDDISLINIYTQDDDVYIRYKVAMTSKINIYTTSDLGDCCENNQIKKVVEEFLVAKYRHSGLAGDHMFSWEAYIDWTHYNFGNIKSWNDQHNNFDGDVVFSFDIAQSPLPQFRTQSGDALTKNFDYIAVSSIAVVDNKHGLLDNSVPDIVGLEPQEYQQTKNEKSILDTFGKTKKWDGQYVPDIDLETFTTPLNTFDSGIMPQTAGSDMHPTQKSGDPIFDPRTKLESQLDCKFIYRVGSISPLVKEYYGRLSYNYIYYHTKDECNFLCIGTHVVTKSNTRYRVTETRPVALHVTNRYIQTEVRVVFDIYTSYNIDVGADGIEDYDLQFPEEYYDLLTWITTVDGFGGGEQHTTGTDFLGLGDFFGNYGWIIIAVIVIIGLVALYIVVIRPIQVARQQRKLIQTALGSTRPE